ncbi:hypothetical protein KAZ66_00255 [Candidatus Woesebacteria bacterium]|nr:hypothetical protein [Candidatus Woesebacteria bacterium]
MQDVNYLNYNSDLAESEKAMTMLYQQIKIFKNIVIVNSAKSKNANDWPFDAVKNLHNQWLVINAYINILKCFSATCRTAFMLEQSISPIVEKLSTYW